MSTAHIIWSMLTSPFILTLIVLIFGSIAYCSVADRRRNKNN